MVNRYWLIENVAKILDFSELMVKINGIIGVVG
jgi:hypothetical protein